MSGFVIEYEWNGRTERKRIEHAPFLEIFDQPWPDINDAEIKDHSKSDGLVNFILLLQICWFVTQVIARAAQGLAVTILEIFTLGIIVWAVLI